MWLFFAFLAPMFYGIANIFDSLLINKHFKNSGVLVFYASVFSVIFIPLVGLFYPVSIPPLSTLPIFCILGIINVAYLYPYYKGLQSDDTSTAVAFFSLSRIFIPIWAFIVIGEKLTLPEYMGVFLIMASSMLLSLKGTLRHIKLSKAVLYILLAAFIISFEGVLLKYLFNMGVSVGTGVAGEMLASTLSVLVLLLHRGTRTAIKDNFSNFKRTIPLFFFEEGATFVAFFSGSVALNIAPVSLVKSITIFSPFFVLLYAKIFGKKYPQLFNEEKGVGVTLKKIILFSLMVIGVVLVAR